MVSSLAVEKKEVEQCQEDCPPRDRKQRDRQKKIVHAVGVMFTTRTGCY